MKNLRVILSIIIAGLIICSIVLLPSFSFSTCELYNEKRFVEGGVLIFGTVLLLLLSSKKRLNITPSLGYLTSLIIALLFVSSFTSAYPDRALIEIGWYIALIQLALVLGFLYQKYSKLFEKIVLAGIILMAAIYSVRVYSEVFTFYLKENYPMWPNARISTILIDGENIAENGFLGFLNYRFLNHIQTWTLPILIYCYINFQNQLVRGFKFLLGFLISSWWMLLFASGARGSIIALVLGLLIIWFIFKEERTPFLKIFVLTFIFGALLYISFFYLLTDEPVRSVARSDSSGRLDQWIVTLKSILSYPFLGVGPMHLADVGGEAKITSPHNIYIMWAAEWGIPAFSIFLYLAGRGFYNWIKSAVINPSPKTIVITFSFIAGAIHSGVSGLLITPLSQLIFIVLVGWAFGIYYEKNNKFLWHNVEKKSITGYTILGIFLIINVMTFSIFINDIHKLEENRDQFHSLHRENRIEMNQKTNPTIFPRFWDQGFIGLEQVGGKE